MFFSKKREHCNNNGFERQPLKIAFIFIFIIILLFIPLISPTIHSQSDDDDDDLFESVKSTNSGKSFKDKLTMESGFPKNVRTIQVEISKDNQTKLDQYSIVNDYIWKFEVSVKNWASGNYNVTLIAKDQNNQTIDQTTFNIDIKGAKDEKEPAFYMPLFCAVILILFIVLSIIFFILSWLKNKRVMTELRFEPKNVEKKLPMMAYMSMLITLLFTIAGMAVCITSDLGLFGFILCLSSLGLVMLVTYWTFSDRNVTNFIIYLILIIISLIATALAGAWSDHEADGLVVSAGLLLAALIIFFISILLYWLTEKRGELIALVVVILSLVFFVIMTVFVILSAIQFIGWWITAAIGGVLTVVMLLASWPVLRNDTFYFETRGESQTTRGWRRSLNMFEIKSRPRGLIEREYLRKVVVKISYEQMQDKTVQMEVVQLRDWETRTGRAQGRLAMNVFVNKMRGKEGPLFNKEPVAKALKYSLYGSDAHFDDKLELCKANGFQVEDSGRERGLDYYDLELVHRPFLGLGSPMGSEKKKRYQDKEKEREAGPRYDYEYEEEQERHKHERGRERGRGRNRERYAQDEEPEPAVDEDNDIDEADSGYVEDWSAQDRRLRRRRQEREQEPERLREPEPKPKPKHEPEKPKKRPPPPKIVREVN